MRALDEGSRNKPSARRDDRSGLSFASFIPGRIIVSTEIDLGPERSVVMI